MGKQTSDRNCETENNWKCSKYEMGDRKKNRTSTQLYSSWKLNIPKSLVYKRFSCCRCFGVMRNWIIFDMGLTYKCIGIIMSFVIGDIRMDIRNIVWKCLWAIKWNIECSNNYDEVFFPISQIIYENNFQGRKLSIRYVNNNFADVWIRNLNETYRMNHPYCMAKHFILFSWNSFIQIFVIISILFWKVEFEFKLISRIWIWLKRTASNTVFSR